MSTQDIFCQLVQIAIGTRDVSEFTAVSQEQWQELFRIAKKQGLLAVTFGAIEKLSPSLQPPLQVKLSWIRCRELIVTQNEKISALCREIDEVLPKVGISSCVLKGQGIATYYPIPEYRNSGDIDLWVRLTTPSDNFESDIDKIIEKVKGLNLGHVHDPEYHHVEWTVQGVEVELHYRPGEFQDKKTNRLYQEWSVNEFDGIKETDYGFHIPSAKFCLVQLMEHMLRHIIMTEGLGMRQMCDYAVLLMKTTKEEKAEALKVIQMLGMSNLARCIMWIMSTAFAVPDEYLLLPPSKKYGTLLIENIWAGGNLGQRMEKEGPDFKTLSFFQKLRYLYNDRKFRFQIAPKEAWAELKGSLKHNREK